MVGIVDFAVTVAAISNHVDDNIAAKFVAIFERHASNADDSVHIFGVHVEDGNLSGDGQSARRNVRNAIRWAAW